MLARITLTMLDDGKSQPDPTLPYFYLLGRKFSSHNGSLSPGIAEIVMQSMRAVASHSSGTNWQN